ncbi:MAG: class II aldolase/adducin family protein [Candidatus Hydrogenedentales bacterium]|jgi:rhamnose utilization protein RhaD (predicted bifunctional aldolase and dehydrogenase)
MYNALILRELLAMSHYLGHEKRGYAILGEGNTSARIDGDHLYVKASGTSLGTMTENDFLPVSISKVTRILDADSATDEDVKEALKGGLVDPTELRMPSVETILHALLYEYPEYSFIGHTHPEAINGILCSVNAEKAMSGRLCPDHIVVMGRASVYVPYVDPGLVLAREVRDRVRHFIERENELPKAVVMQNHGFFALGATVKAVTAITDMAEKMSRILISTYAMGGPQFMSDKDIDRIASRPDEKYRQEKLV